MCNWKQSLLPLLPTKTTITNKPSNPSFNETLSQQLHVAVVDHCNFTSDTLFPATNMKLCCELPHQIVCNYANQIDIYKMNTIITKNEQ